MSKMSGDTARFNRIRKHKTRMRERIAKLRASIEARKAAAETAKPKT